MSLAKKNNLNVNDNYQFDELDHDFTMKEFLTALNNTKKSAPGPDGIKYEIYKNCNTSFIKAILGLFNKIWKQSKIPSRWKITHVIPVPKSTGTLSADQIRPINLIITRAKLMEKMINNRLIYCLEKKKLINPTQFGFRQNKQTLDSMIKLDLDVKSSIDNRKHLHLISFDIQKAFDKVWPEAVVYKLKQLGFGGKMLELNG